MNIEAPEQEEIEEKRLKNNLDLTLDYSLKTMEARRDLVDKIIQSTPPQQLTNRYLEILGDYIMGALSKQEKKEKLYLTNNRLVTINKRETSLEGLSEKFENGEDGVYNLMTNDKNILLQPKTQITQKDINEVPGLAALRAAIQQVEEAGKSATGRRKYLLKKQLIEMRQDQYILKTEFRQPMRASSIGNIARLSKSSIDLTEKRYVDENGEPQSDGLITFFNPKHIAAIMRAYKSLKEELQNEYQNDFYYLLKDFDLLLDRTLKDYPIYKDLVKLKLQGQSNINIQKYFQNKYNTTYSTEYISSLWCNKIPKMCAEKEKCDYLIWYYTHEARGEWKRCSCCKQWKLANYRFFSRNNTSKDNLYSICKECRRKKRTEWKKK